MSDTRAGLTASAIRAADPQLTLNLIDQWPQSAATRTDHVDAYAVTVRTPEWEGQAASAAVSAASRHHATVADDSATIHALHSRAVTAMDTVIKARSDVLSLIDDARSSGQFAVSDDLQVTAADIEYQAAANAKEMEIRQAAQQWSNAETHAANEIRAGAQPLTENASRSGIQLVDHRVPLAPFAPFPQDIPPAASDEYDLRPPPGSGRISGRWQIDYSQPYDKLPDFPTGPGGPQIPGAEYRKFDSPIVGASTGLQPIGSPQPSSVRGGEPAVVGKEAYRFRIVGERFTPDPGHTQWIQKDGNYYKAQWIDHDVQVEHVTQVSATGNLAGLPPIQSGLNEWKSIDNAGIFAIISDRPNMNLYIPDINGNSQMLGPDMPSPGGPQIPRMYPAP